MVPTGPAPLKAGCELECPEERTRRPIGRAPLSENVGRVAEAARAGLGGPQLPSCGAAGLENWRLGYESARSAKLI
jgi:hypothetical protein